MGVANRDASQITKQRRNIAQNAYSNDLKTAVLSGNAAGTSPARTSAEVVSEIKLGCVACYTINGNDPNQPRYPKNVSSGRNTGTS
jgi:hypothetical protein